MTAAAHSLLMAAATQTEEVDLGAPAIVWGIGAFAILMVLLLGTLVFGKGRS
jgi:hypothetical protein